VDDAHASRLPDYDQSDEARLVHLHQAGAPEYDPHAEAITSRFRREDAPAIDQRFLNFTAAWIPEKSSFTK